MSDFFVDDGAIDFVGLDEVSDGGNVSTFVVHGEIDLQEKRLALERVAVDDQNLLRLTAFLTLTNCRTEQGSESFEIATKKRSGTSFATTGSDLMALSELRAGARV